MRFGLFEPFLLCRLFDEPSLQYCAEHGESLTEVNDVC